MFSFAFAFWSAYIAWAPTVEIYRFQHAAADYVMSAIAPMPETGLPKLVPDVVSWVVDPGSNSVILRGSKPQLNQLIPVLKAYDVRSPTLTFTIKGKIPSIGHDQAQSVQLSAGSTWRVDDPILSLTMQIKVRVAKGDFALLDLEHKFRGTTSKFSFRIKAGETVSLTPEKLDSKVAPAPLELKVTLAKIAKRS